MVELQGSLASIEIGPLARFLCALGKSGDLLVSSAGWTGKLSLEAGVLTDGRIESESGADAFRAIATTSIDGTFEFVEGRPSLAPNPALGPDALAMLECPRPDRDVWNGHIPRPDDVPRRVLSADDESGSVTLNRATVRLLLEADGHSTIRDLAARDGLLRTLDALAQLRDLGLIQLETPQSAIAEPADRAEPPESPPRTIVEQAKSRIIRLRRHLSRVLSTRAGAIGLELARSIVVTVALVLGVRALLLNFRIEGVSMEPTFQSGQVVLVNRAVYFHVDSGPLSTLLPLQHQGTINYLFGGPHRGDVVVFHAPPQPGSDYIKRIIGLPGDTISIDSGVVRVNGVPLNEPYIRVPANYRFPSSGTAQVPDDSYFVLGDNRPESLDSHFGWFVPVSDLVGEAWIRYWPLKATSIVQGAAATQASVPANTAGQPGNASN